MRENKTKSQYSSRLRITAEAAKFFVKRQLSDEDQQAAKMLIREGIRKMHDVASSQKGTGKYLGHIHWSKKATELFPDGTKITNITHLLSHEHVVPVSYVAKKLFQLPPNASIEDFEALIEKYSVVAIITREEAKKLEKLMPANWETEANPEVFVRYIKAGLINEIICPDRGKCMYCPKTTCAEIAK